jgi:hypothetical protein
MAIMELNDSDLQTIRERAYFKWLDDGAPCCDGVDYWLDAESEYMHDPDRLAQEQSTAQRGRAARPPAGRSLRSSNPSMPSKDELIGSRG